MRLFDLSRQAQEMCFTRVYPKVSGLAALERELQVVELSATVCSYMLLCESV